MERTERTERIARELVAERISLSDVMKELEPSSEKAGFRYESDTRKAHPYWDGRDMVSSTTLWKELCERVLERMKKGQSIEDAYEQECNDGGIEADYMDDNEREVHFAVDEGHIGGDATFDDAEKVAEYLTEHGFPTVAYRTAPMRHEPTLNLIPDRLWNEAVERLGLG